jgi:hypothetical protein
MNLCLKTAREARPEIIRRAEAGSGTDVEDVVPDVDSKPNAPKMLLDEMNQSPVATKTPST